MVVGIFGVQYYSENYGVSALTHSIINVIADNCVNIEKINLFSNEKIDLEITGSNGNCVSISSFSHSYKNINQLRQVVAEIKMCDLIMDFSEGDSFSTIYGNKRYMKVLLDKLLVIRCHKRLVLMPQTYGPYTKNILNIFLPYIFKKSSFIMSRDAASVKDINRFFKTNVKVTTDVAFFLKYNVMPKEESLTVGFNVSGLLWNGGYTGNNQFGLKADYREVCRALIEKMHEMNYKIILIPHVITSQYESVENDLAVCKALSKEYKFCKVECGYDNPVSAKTVISSTDLFIGSRMHSTIAALSSGVPTIPLSYSKKFVGLFENVKYDVDVPLYKNGTKQCISRTISYIEKYGILQKKTLQAQKIVESEKKEFIMFLNEVLKE